MKFTFIKEVVSQIFFWVPYIKKFIYPKKKFLNDIEIGTNNMYPVDFIMNTTIPEVNIWLRVVNLSQFLDIETTDINIKSLRINAGGNHRILKNKDKILKVEILKKSLGELNTDFELSEKQIEIMNNIREPYNLTANLDIEVSIESKLYKHTFGKSFSNIPCRLGLSKTPLSFHKEMLLRCEKENCGIAKDYQDVLRN